MEKIICVDIQPAYKDSEYLLSNLNEYLKDKEVLFMYNDTDISGDYLFEIKDYWYKYGTDINQFQLYEKTYAFFRNWMDYGIDEDTIIECLRYMIKNGISDSREIDSEVLEEKFPDCPFEDCIYIPEFLTDFNFNQWENCILIGGGFDECLAEIRIWLEVLEIPYTINHKFIY